MSRRARALINVEAIERNASLLKGRVGPSSELCAVVKADGYGHGALESSRAALRGGATWLAVATANEAAALRRELPSTPILVMGPLDANDLAVALALDVDVVAWSHDFVESVVATQKGGVRLHLKVDTGMGRLGVREPSEVARLVAHIDESDGVVLAGLMTHFASADATDDDFFNHQLTDFSALASELRRTHRELVVHAANSAATLRDPASHFDMVRCGVALYGLDPFQHDPSDFHLEPALELRSYVARVERLRANESVGYGRHYRAPTATFIATVPIGYGDGLRRSKDPSIEVLIAGQRRPLAGVMSMDSCGVDLGPVSDVHVGDEVVVIGASGSERILVEELAQRHGTINYEVVCNLGARVERSYGRDATLS